MNLRPFLAVAAAVIGAMLAVSAWGWTQIPADAQVPIHWGIDGRADGFAPKPIGLFGVPVLAVGLTLLLLAVPRVEPRRDNLRRSSTAYRAIAIAILLVMGTIHTATVLAATGADVDIAGVVAGVIGAMFVVIGNYLGKVRSNFMVGIRTPWTLTSERSWDRTHRLGGRLMVVLGTAVVVATLLGVRGAGLFALVGAGAAAFVLALFVYSYLVWRDDPDRRTLGGDAR
jgi:uncharacterized membrane protein